MVTINELRTHIASKFEGRTVDAFPSPHLIINDFFPDAVYQQILANNLFTWNRGQEWISTAEMKNRRQSTPYDHRKQVDLVRTDFDAAPEAKEFWTTIRRAFLDDNWFAKLIYKTYPAYFDLRFGEAVLEDSFWSRLRHMMFLQRHDQGYSIGPHTDSPHRVFTCIFAFADAEGFDEFGTQFHRPRDPDARCWGDLHHPFEDFETVKIAKYIPNNFVVFFKTRHSFHSVKALTRKLPNDRFGMQLGYYEPRAGLFRDLSRPDLMEDRTTKPIFKVTAFKRSLQLIRTS